MPQPWSPLAENQIKYIFSVYYGNKKTICYAMDCYFLKYDKQDFLSCVSRLTSCLGYSLGDAVASRDKSSTIFYNIDFTCPVYIREEIFISESIKLI